MKDPIIQDSARYRQISTSFNESSDFQEPVNAKAENYRARKVVLSRSENGAASFVSAQSETVAPKRSFFMTLIRRVFQPADQEKAKRVKEEKQALKDRVAKAKRLTVEFEAFNKLLKINLKAEQNRTKNSSITDNAPQVYRKTVMEFNGKTIRPLNEFWNNIFDNKGNTFVQKPHLPAAAKTVRQEIAQASAPAKAIKKVTFKDPISTTRVFSDRNDAPKKRNRIVMGTAVPSRKPDAAQKPLAAPAPLREKNNIAMGTEVLPRKAKEEFSLRM